MFRKTEKVNDYFSLSVLPYITYSICSNFNTRELNARELFWCFGHSSEYSGTFFSENWGKFFLQTSRTFLKPPGPQKNQENQNLETKILKNPKTSPRLMNFERIFGSEIVPGEEFKVQHLNLTSKIAKSGAQRPKSRKSRRGTLFF